MLSNNSLTSSSTNANKTTNILITAQNISRAALYVSVGLLMRGAINTENESSHDAAHNQSAVLSYYNLMILNQYTYVLATNMNREKLL